MSMFVPPVLRDVDFVGIDDDYEGHTAMVFRSRDPNIRGDGFVRITVLTRGKPVFVYTRYDADIGVICHYRGPYGDPLQDTMTTVKSAAKPD